MEISSQCGAHFRDFERRVSRVRRLGGDWKEGNHGSAFVVLNYELHTSRMGLRPGFLAIVVFARPEIIVGMTRPSEGLIISAFVVVIGEGLEHHGSDVPRRVISAKSLSSISSSHQPVVLFGC